MKIKKKDLDDRQVQLTVEVPPDRVEAAKRVAARRLSKRTKFPGFRPGKAPYDVVLRKFGDETLFEEALDDLGQDIYREAIDQAEIEPYAPGSLEEVVGKDPLVLRYIVPQAPLVELGGYRKLRLPYKKAKVEDKALDEAMEEIRQGQALIEPAQRAAQMGDVIILDVKAVMPKPDEGMNPSLLDERDLSLLVSEETQWPFAGFEKQLVGLAAGDEKDFSHKFAKDHPNEALRNRAADFHLLCKEVKSRFVPEWSDNLARAVGEFNDLLELRIQVREQLEAQAQRKQDSEYARSVIDAAVSGSEVSYPPVLLDEELDGMLRDLSRRLENQRLGLDDYLKIEGKTIEELREELKPQAEERLKQALVLGKVVDIEAIEVNGDEVKAEIDRLVAPFGENAGKLRKSFEQPIGRRRVELDLLTEKAIARLMAIAKGEVDSPKAKEPKTAAKERKKSPKAQGKAAAAKSTAKSPKAKDQGTIDQPQETDKDNPQE